MRMVAVFVLGVVCGAVLAEAWAQKCREADAAREWAEVVQWEAAAWLERAGR